MKKSVFCIVPTISQADSIVTELKQVGFVDNDISALFPDKKGSQDFAHEHHTKAPEGAVAGATAGGALGGTLGLLAGIGALAIPGLGPFIAAGPLMATLSGVAVGGAVGGLTGALVGMGIPEYEAKRYENKLREGNILVAVHTEDAKQQEAAKKIFERLGARDIASAAEGKAPKPAQA